MRLPFVTSLLLVTASVAAAQQPARYRGHADTVFVQQVNPYRLYWVRGTDTLGAAPNEVTVERNVTTETNDGIETVTVSLRQDVRRTERTRRYGFSPAGRTLSVDGVAPGWSAGHDMRFHIPTVPLVAGATWSDSTGADSVGSPAPRSYRVARSYRVDRVIDTLGARVADISASGQVRYADGFQADSAGRFALWMDARGPVAERYLFDLTHGRMIYRRWEMDLRGPGTVRRPDGGVDTVPAGLRSIQVEREVPAALGRLLVRDLPGRDTSVTIQGKNAVPVLLHTTGRRPGLVESGMVRNDGMMGTATLRIAGATPVEYTSLWTDSTSTPARFHVIRSPRGLVVSRGSRDTTLAVPDGPWVVADYGFEEMLAPVVLMRGADTTPVPLAIYRPYAGHWDARTLSVQRRDGISVALLRANGVPESRLMFTEDGTLLFVQDLRTGTGFRVPAEGSAAAQRLLQLRSRRDAQERAPAPTS